MKKFVVTIAIILLLASSAHAQTPFYQGKTITIIVGTKAGDAYDLYPRMLAEFMPKYIPGNPNIIIQNVPGAASMIAAICGVGANSWIFPSIFRAASARLA